MIFLLFVTIAAAKERKPRSHQFFWIPHVDCGEFFYNEEEARIQSPGWPGSFSPYAMCTWDIEHECAESFTVTPLRFVLTPHAVCPWDRVEFVAFGDMNVSNEDKIVYCGGEIIRYNIDEAIEWAENSGLYDNDGITYNGKGMNESFVIEGNQLQVQFVGEESFSLEELSFDLRITPNIKSGCIPGVTRPAPVCRPNIKFPTAAVYKTTNSFDLAVPFSDYSGIAQVDATAKNINDECIERCMDTAGCFKVKRTVESNTFFCNLSGNVLDPSQSNTFAVNGRNCKNDASRIWIDAKTITDVSCLFHLTESAESYLDYLNQRNPTMLEWVSTNSDTMIDQTLTSKKWSFSVDERRHSDHGIWYTFHSVTYFRQLLSDDSRRRRDVKTDALFQSFAEELAAEFVRDLDIGDVGATVLQTEDPVIELEILEEVVQPQDVEFAAAFDAVEEIIHDAVMALPKWKNVKGLQWSRKRFGWFTEFSDAPCINYAGEGAGAGIDYNPPTVNAEDVCSTIVSFHNALLGYFDDFVCLDRSDENPFGKKRMETRTKHLLFNRSKVHYNRFLKKLSCQQRV